MSSRIQTKFLLNKRCYTGDLSSNSRRSMIDLDDVGAGSTKLSEVIAAFT